MSSRRAEEGEGRAPSIRGSRGWVLLWRAQSRPCDILPAICACLHDAGRAGTELHAFGLGLAGFPSWRVCFAVGCPLVAPGSWVLCAPDSLNWAFVGHDRQASDSRIAHPASGSALFPASALL